MQKSMLSDRFLRKAIMGALTVLILLACGVTVAFATNTAKSLPNKLIQLKLNGQSINCSMAGCAALNGVGGERVGNSEFFIKQCKDSNHYFMSCRLKQDTIFKVVVKGAGVMDIPLSANAGNYSRVVIYPNDNIYGGWLVRDTVIRLPRQNHNWRMGEVVCKGNHYIEFYQTGTLKVCVLKETSTLLKVVPGGNPKPVTCYTGTKGHEGHAGFDANQLVTNCKEKP